MFFVGVDLAWGVRSPSGVAVVDDSGELVQVGAAREDASILSAIRPYAEGECVLGIDAPLVVTNPDGNRPCEAALNRDYRAFEAGTHPSNTTRPWFADGTRGGRLADALGLDLDPRANGRRALEVYPHAATVALFGLSKTLKYKQKQGREHAQLKGELLRLLDLVEGLHTAALPMLVGGHPDWRAIRHGVETSTRKCELRRVEDPVDAVVCAYVAMYATRRPDHTTVYGDASTGYIVTPTICAVP